MKNMLCAMLLITVSLYLNAQYVTPGNGDVFSLDDLVDVSGGAVQSSGENYILTAEITISANDVLSVTDNATIVCDGGTKITVLGTVEINPPEELLIVSSDTIDLSNPFLNIYLHDAGADNSIIRNLSMRFCCGLKISDADNVLVENCTFYKNQYDSSHGSAAVVVSGCNPVIRNCEFISNLYGAVNTPANGYCSPVIENCRMIKNCTANANYPQINLGPGSETDTLYVFNNYIEGHVDMSGGISFSTLVGGTLKAVMKGNVIVDNRYGVNQYGNDIVLFAIDNIIEDNNLETNPMNGGSGITVYSTNTTTKLYASGNIITGNLWGITLVGNAMANLGNINGSGVEYNAGKNIIVDNVNGGVTYNLYNNTANDQVAENNYWGFATEEESEGVIWDSNDISTLGTVDYSPIWAPEYAPEVQTSIAYITEMSAAASFVPNDVTKYYFVLMGRDNEIQTWAQSLQISIEALLQTYGTQQRGDYSCEYDELLSGTEYTVYVLPLYYNNTAATLSTTAFTTLGENGFKDEISLSVYPNPARDRVFVTGADVEYLRLINSTGAVVKVVYASSMEVSGLSSGFYLLQIKTADGRIIIEKIAVK